MPLIPLNIPAGQYRNGTELMSQGRWRDANLVRWHEDALRPIGGWRQRGSVDLTNPARGMKAWIDNSDDRYVAMGTYDGLFVMDSGSAVYDITPAGFTDGRLDATAFVGYGASTYGSYAYGVARPDSGTILTATTWSLDNWGEYLVGCSSDDGRLVEWQLSTGTAAAVVANAPTSNIGIFVTEERFVVCLGAGGDRRKVQWSDQEDNTTWTAAATNQAGDILLQTNGTILQGVRTRGQSLIITTETAHTMTYQGPPFVYGFEQVGTACGGVSNLCAATVDQGVFWMGQNGFFAYNGGAVQQLNCDVADHVFRNFNRDQESKVVAVTNAQWGEIWWFYPSGDSTENDSYVVYDYLENIWATGTIDRTAGVDAGVFQKPMWMKSDGVLYEHEVGTDYDSSTPFAETGPISIGNGDSVMKVTNLIPDEKTQGDVQAKFKTRFYPNGTETEYGPFTMSNPTSVRFQGRQVRMRVEGNAASDWRVGLMRIDAKAGGMR